MAPPIVQLNAAPRGRTWKVTFAFIFIAQFLSGVGFYFVLPFFPFYFRALGVVDLRENLLWVGWSSAAFGIAMAVSAPLWGLVADRYGRKLMVIRSMLGGSIVLGLMGFATAPWHLLALRIFQGLFTGTVSASVTLVTSVTPPANLGVSLGLLQTALLLGNSIGPFFGGMISDRYGFRIPCFIAFGTLFIGMLLVLFGVSETFVRPRKDKKNNGFNILKNILNTKGFKILLLTYFSIYVINFMVIPILPLFIEHLSGTTKNAASLTGFFVASMGFISGISATLLGRLVDRIGAGKILFFSLFAAGIISIPQSFANNLIILFIERCLLGLAIGGALPSTHVLVSKTISPERVGGAYGLTASVICLGIGAGPLIGGYLASFMGLRAPFAAMGLLALILAFSLKKTIVSPDN